MAQQEKGKHLGAVFFTLSERTEGEAEAALATLIEVLLKLREAPPR